MIVLGHRGGRGDGWPAENTLAAFQRALDEGADGVELDVRLCASGEAVLVHDRRLPSHLTGRPGAPLVHALRRSELPLLRGGERIPTLAEALDLCHDRVVNVEVKADVPDRLALVRVVARDIARARPVDVVVSSFDPFVVLAFRAIAPKVPRGMLVGARTPWLGTALPLAMRRAVLAAHLEDPLVHDVRVARLRRAGLRLLAWTVNEPARARALSAMGVEMLITDRPAEILSALRPGERVRAAG